MLKGPSSHPGSRGSRVRVVLLAAAVGITCLLIYGSRPRSAPRIMPCDSPSIVIHKAEGILELSCDGAPRGKYLATFGQNPVGPKLREGDERTPEGNYHISSRVETRRFHRFLGVSYPNADDLQRAKQLSITRPGGGIGIHGVDVRRAGMARLWLRAGHLLGLNRLWGPTDGCIGVSNEDIEVIYVAARVGTPVRINP